MATCSASAYSALILSELFLFNHLFHKHSIDWLLCLELLWATKSHTLGRPFQLSNIWVGQIVKFSLQYINVWGFYYFVIFLQVHGVIAKTNSSIIILKFDMINCKIDLLIYFGFGLICQFTWQPYIYADDTCERGNPG